MTQYFGDKQEQDVAFHLRRAFKDSTNIKVFHDLRFSWEGENAQIDHLVLHKHGFIVIESKSIRGEVKVNAHREWSRSYQGSWYGLPSPVQQAENQIKILKSVLINERGKLLGKMLGIQKGFTHRKFDVLVAVSSSAIIHRENMPEEVSRLVVKSEFIPEQATKIMKGYNSGILGSDPDFSKEELGTIGNYLASHQSLSGSDVEEQVVIPTVAAIQPVSHVVSGGPQARAPKQWQASCKHCNNAQGLEGKWGKFGYYVICSLCNKNTPLKQPCPKCQAETKLSKSRSVYTVNCAACGEVGKILVG